MPDADGRSWVVGGLGLGPGCGLLDASSLMCVTQVEMQQPDPKASTRPPSGSGMTRVARRAAKCLMCRRQLEKHLLLGCSDPKSTSRPPGSGRAEKLRKRSGGRAPDWKRSGGSSQTPYRQRTATSGTGE